jgi:hypothetical protein
MSAADIITLVAVAGGLSVVCALLVWLISMGSRPGYEDEDGFHEGEPPPKKSVSGNRGRFGAVALALIAAAALSACESDKPTRYPGGTDRPYSTSNGVPIHLPQEI